MAKRIFPGIPDPSRTVDGMFDAVMAMKQICEILTGQRGSNPAVLVNDNLVGYIYRAMFNSVKVTVFTASGTFTPDPKMQWCEVEAWGGGGGGGGVPASGAGTVSASTGGNGGAKARLIADKATIGASQAVTIGGGGAGGAAGQNNGVAGTATTLGALLSAKGGEGGVSSAAAAAVGPVPSVPTQSATGTVRGWTQRSTTAGYSTTSGFAMNANSGSNELGGAISGTVNAAGVAANANTGAGGGGVTLTVSQAAQAGGAGGSGLMVIKEYLSAS